MRRIGQKEKNNERTRRNRRHTKKHEKQYYTTKHDYTKKIDVEIVQKVILGSAQIKNLKRRPRQNGTCFEIKVGHGYELKSRYCTYTEGARDRNEMVLHLYQRVQGHNQADSKSRYCTYTEQGPGKPASEHETNPSIRDTNQVTQGDVHDKHKKQRGKKTRAICSVQERS